MKSELIGFAAAFLTTFSFVPQVVRAVKTKHTRSISLPMYIILAAGVFLWLIYGILNDSLPIIAANAVTFILAIVILIVKVRNG